MEIILNLNHFGQLKILSEVIQDCILLILCLFYLLGKEVLESDRFQSGKQGKKEEKLTITSPCIVIWLELVICI